MKRLASALGFIILFVFISNDSLAQKATYATNGGMMIGFGGGMSYQKSDLANSGGFGFDFILGSQIHKRENAFLSVDWKFRFLAGQNKGYDHRINPDDTYSNIRYRFFTYDLELGLTLNRLRERTRIIITGFAGAGITHGTTFTDLYDAGGGVYDFSSIDPNLGQKMVFNDLVALSDGDFETRLVNKAALLPTAGIYLGYQLSRSFMLGVEFKSNFYLTERNSFVGIDLDNRVFAGSGIDRNNYVSLGFRWNLGRGSTYRAATGTYSSHVTGSYGTTTVTQHYAASVSSPHPSVNITEPTAEPYHTLSPNQTIRATITDVSGPEAIRFFQNGFPVNAFTYNVNTNAFLASVRLRNGENSFLIKASNQMATAEDMATITLDGPPENEIAAPAMVITSPGGNLNTIPEDGIAPPAVWFTNPLYPIEVIDNEFHLRARTENVFDRNKLYLTINGYALDNFSFGHPGEVVASLHLTEGVNIVEIFAENEAGMASDRASITFHPPVYYVPVYRDPIQRDPVQRDPVHQEPVRRDPLSRDPVQRNPDTRDQVQRDPVTRDPVSRPCAPPAVSFDLQEVKGADATHELRGSVSGVKNIADISLALDGKVQKGIQFVPSSGLLSTNLNLAPGSHTIVVAASNECGTDFESVSVTYSIVDDGDEDDGGDKGECAIRINPGNSDWQFCLVSPSGTYNRTDLGNSNFSYSGSASSLFILPIGGGGEATVNGQPYAIRSGQYYLFKGSLQVSVSNNHPGAMGHWSVCISSNSAPQSGNGGKRPNSPCEEEEHAPDRGNNTNRGSNKSTGNGTVSNGTGPGTYTRSNKGSANRSNTVERTNTVSRSSYRPDYRTKPGSGTPAKSASISRDTTSARTKQRPNSGTTSRTSDRRERR
jgi:hypothetical protein